MSKIKWIISDLDGTLLHHDHSKVPRQISIDKETIRMINEAIKNGIHFSIATGRHYYNALKITDPIINYPKNSFIIGLNGAQIYSLDEKKLIYDVGIDEKYRKDIINLIDKSNAKYKNGLIFFAYCEDRKIIFIKNSCPDFQKVYDLAISYESNTDSFDYSIENSVKEIPKILKICVFNNSHEQDMWKILDFFKSITNQLDYVLSGEVYLEIIPKNISKGRAIDLINNNYYHLNKNQIITFGDSGNDIDMFQRSEISVTRDSAADYVKKAVTHVYHGEPSTFIGNAIHDLKISSKK